ncbi:hypothetical protein JKP88DRAFT_251072 [Tribonema minus]|uniref:GH26 domain-containing protein n=1 Tax=Tribonema minus TaxID=303371 RepID=A0A835ZE63_9STRA|nr:hypothetical protein JKP88DRAFT_251072 [Tribonema minus]
MSIYDRERAYRVSIDSILVYQPVQGLRWDWIKGYLNDGFKVQLVIEFREYYANLGSIAGGKYDWELINFAQDAKKDGRQITIRILHEFNGDWYPWGVFRNGNSIDQFKNAFRHVVSVMRSQGMPAKYQLSYNVKNANNNGTPLSAFYPGGDYVDQVSAVLLYAWLMYTAEDAGASYKNTMRQRLHSMRRNDHRACPAAAQICVSAYNFAGTSQWHASFESFHDVLADTYKQIVDFTGGGKPLCIAEMSSTSYGGDKSRWIRDAWNTLAYTFTKVTTINWFLERQSDKSPPLDWDLDTQGQIDAWVSGLNAFRGATRLPTNADAYDAPPVAPSADVARYEAALAREIAALQRAGIDASLPPKRVPPLVGGFGEQFNDDNGGGAAAAGDVNDGDGGGEGAGETGDPGVSGELHAGPGGGV